MDESRRVRDGARFAFGRLVLDLQADDEEKQDHQDVVHPQPENQTVALMGERLPGADRQLDGVSPPLHASLRIERFPGIGRTRSDRLAR